MRKIYLPLQLQGRNQDQILDFISLGLKNHLFKISITYHFLKVLMPVLLVQKRLSMGVLKQFDLEISSINEIFWVRKKLTHILIHTWLMIWMYVFVLFIKGINENKRLCSITLSTLHYLILPKISFCSWF